MHVLMGVNFHVSEAPLVIEQRLPGGHISINDHKRLNMSILHCMFSQVCHARRLVLGMSV